MEMMMGFSPENDKILLEIKEKASLARSYKDHRRIGSSPRDPRQAENPDLTLSDILNDEEIRNYLDDFKRSVIGWKPADPNDLVNNHNYKQIKEDFLKNINYLKMIGKLPTEYENMDESEL